eukprot:TRINITY_DN21099_c0_g2_i1.p1 TRINITY_DN21099_c0_g2~~TRINITY_DN21099_c0_g2_i1.p1  ORF type:complete len:2659 (-),score=346.99 TRINITY_DN21099_c0_g2_i1:354-8225(-)
MAAEVSAAWYLRFLRHRCFHAWSEVTREASFQSERRCIRSVAVEAAVDGRRCAALRSCLGAWRDVLLAFRRQALEVERHRLTRLMSTSVDQVLQHLVKSSDSAFRRICFAEWRSAVGRIQAEVQEKLMRSGIAVNLASMFTQSLLGACSRVHFTAWRRVLEDRRRAFEANGQRELAMKTLLRLSQQDASMTLRLCVETWYSLSEDARKAVADRQRRTLQLERGLERNSRFSDQVLQHAYFVDWAILVTANIAVIAERAEWSRALAATIHGSSDVTAHLCLASWRSACVKLGSTAADEIHHLWGALKSMQLRRALDVMGQSADRSLQHRVFVAWESVVSETKAASAELVRRSEVSVRALTSMIHSSVDAFARHCVASWQSVVQHERRTALIEAERQKFKCLRDSQIYGAIRIKARASERAEQHSLFLDWFEVVKSRKAVFVKRMRRTEAVVSVLTGMVCSSLDAVVRYCVLAWRSVAEEKRKEASDFERQRRTCLQDKQLQRALRSMAHLSERAFQSEVFVEWRNRVKSSKIELTVRAKRSDVAVKALASMTHSSIAAATRHYFAAWRRVVEERRLEAVETQRQRWSLLEQKHRECALRSMAFFSDQALQHSVFVDWAGFVMIRKVDLADRARRSDVAVRALVSMLHSSLDASARQCVAVWRNVLETRRKADAEKMLREWKSLKQSQILRAMDGVGRSFARALQQACFAEWRSVLELLYAEMKKRAMQSEVAVRALASMAQSSIHACGRHCIVAWRSTLEEKRTNEFQAERERWVCLRNKQLELALQSMGYVSEQALQRNLYVEWRSVVGSRKAARATCVFRSEVVVKALASMTHSSIAAATRHYFAAWRRVVEERRLEAVETQRQRWSLLEQKHRECALRSMAFFSDQALQHSVFVDWAGFVMIRKVDLADRARRSDVAVRALVSMLHSSLDASARQCVAVWRNVLETRRKADAEKMLREWKSLKQSQILRAMDGVGRSFARALQQACFAEWRSVLELLYAEMKKRAMQSEVAVRALASMAQSSIHACGRHCIVAWRSTLEEKRTNEFQAERERWVCLRNKQLELALQSMGYVSEQALQRNLYVEWRSVVGSRKAARATCVFRSEVAMKALASMLQSSIDAVARFCMAAWRSVLEDARKAAIEAERQRLSLLKGNHIHRAIRSFTHMSERGIQHSFFFDWASVVTTSKAECANDVKRSEVVAWALASMMHLSDDATACHVFAAWRTVIQEHRRKDMERKRYQCVSLKGRQLDRAVLSISRDAHEAVQRGFFADWRCFVWKRKVDLAERARRSDVAVRALAGILHFSIDALTRHCMLGWWNILEETRRAASEMERYQSLKGRQLERALRSMAHVSERAVQRSLFVDWRNVAKTSKAQLAVHARRSEAAVKALTCLVHSSTDATLRCCIGAWRSVLDDSRREAIEAERRQWTCLKSNQMERALRGMAHMSQRTLQHMLYRGWREEARTCKMNLLNRARRSEVAIHALASMMHSCVTTVARHCVAAWRDTLKSQRTESVEHMRQEWAAMKSRQFDRTANRAARASEQALRHSVFVEWCRIARMTWAESVERANRTEVATWILASAAHFSVCATCRHCVTAWRSALQDRLRAVIEAERLRSSSVKSIRCKYALQSTGGLQKWILRRGCLFEWRTVTRTNRTRWAELSRGSRAATEALGQACLFAWLVVVEDSRRCRIADADRLRNVRQCKRLLLARTDALEREVRYCCFFAWLSIRRQSKAEEQSLERGQRAELSELLLEEQEEILLLSQVTWAWRLARSRGELQRKHLHLLSQQEVAACASRRLQELGAETQAVAVSSQRERARLLDLRVGLLGGAAGAMAFANVRAVLAAAFATWYGEAAFESRRRLSRERTAYVTCRCKAALLLGAAMFRWRSSSRCSRVAADCEQELRQREAQQDARDARGVAAAMAMAEKSGYRLMLQHVVLVWVRRCAVAQGQRRSSGAVARRGAFDTACRAAVALDVGCVRALVARTFAAWVKALVWIGCARTRRLFTARLWRSNLSTDMRAALTQWRLTSLSRCWQGHRHDVVQLCASACDLQDRVAVRLRRNALLPLVVGFLAWRQVFEASRTPFRHSSLSTAQGVGGRDGQCLEVLPGRAVEFVAKWEKLVVREVFLHWSSWMEVARVERRSKIRQETPPAPIRVWCDLIRPPAATSGCGAAASSGGGVPVRAHSQEPNRGCRVSWGRISSSSLGGSSGSVEPRPRSAPPRRNSRNDFLRQQVGHAAADVGPTRQCCPSSMHPSTQARGGAAVIPPPVVPSLFARRGSTSDLSTPTHGPSSPRSDLGAWEDWGAPPLPCAPVRSPRGLRSPSVVAGRKGLTIDRKHVLHDPPSGQALATPRVMAAPFASTPVGVVVHNCRAQLPTAATPLTAASQIAASAPTTPARSLTPRAVSPRTTSTPAAVTAAFSTPPRTLTHREFTPGRAVTPRPAASPWVAPTPTTPVAATVTSGGICGGVGGFVEAQLSSVSPRVQRSRSSPTDGIVASMSVPTTASPASTLASSGTTLRALSMSVPSLPGNCPAKLLGRHLSVDCVAAGGTSICRPLSPYRVRHLPAVFADTPRRLASQPVLASVGSTAASAVAGGISRRGGESGLGSCRAASNSTPAP